jgi:hypothetical protein
MKYYVYISESKVDMLYSQIPKNILQNVAGKLTIDLKLIKTEFSENPPRETLIYKLRIVEDYIMNNEDVGTVKDIKNYINDTLYMKWGPISQEMAYFCYCKENFVLGLGGSLKHVIGNVGGAVTNAHSTVPYISAALKNEVLSNEFLSYAEQSFESTVLSAVKIVSLQMKGVEEKLSFLAKRLLYSHKKECDHEYSTETIVLGTPLYVALEN